MGASMGADDLAAVLASVADPTTRAVLQQLMRGLPDLLAATRAAAVRDSAVRLADEVGARMRLQAQVESLSQDLEDLRKRLEGE